MTLFGSAVELLGVGDLLEEYVTRSMEKVCGFVAQPLSMLPQRFHRSSQSHAPACLPHHEGLCVLETVSQKTFLSLKISLSGVLS